MQRYSTYREYLAHPLFRIARSAALRRARGICEICGKAQATEVHHLQYPLWGTFDTPTNLQAACHSCHSVEHDKVHDV
jgi:hypothetical protein